MICATLATNPTRALSWRSACRRTLAALAGLMLLLGGTAQAACSNYVGSATLNEVFRGVGSFAGRFIEIKLLGSVPSAIFQNWTLRFCHDTPATCVDVPLSGAAVNLPYLTLSEQPAAAFYDFNDMDLALLDQHGKVIDYLVTEDYNAQQAGLDCAGLLYDYDTGTIIQNSFTVFRIPDGVGLWQQSPGNSAKETPVEPNDYNDPDYVASDIVASIDNVNVVQGGTATFTVNLASASGTPPIYPYTVDWATYDHSAVAGVDYVAASGTLTLNSGYSATITVTTQVSGASESRQFYVALDGPSEGLLDPQVGTATILPSSALHHYELSLASAAINCLPTNVTVTACADSATPCTVPFSALAGQSVTLSTTAGTLDSTTLLFDTGGHATTLLHNPAASAGTVASVGIAAVSTTAAQPNHCCPDGSGCTVSDSCSVTYTQAGLVFADTPNGLAAAVGPQIAGVTSNVRYLRAVQSNGSSETCAGALTGTQTIDFAYECNDPLSCYAGNLMQIIGAGVATTIARNNNNAVTSYLPVSLNFDANGNAPFTLVYQDSGQTSLHARKQVGSSWLNGSSDGFVTKPDHFALVVADNPGTATDADGPVFKRAGEPFAVTVTARSATDQVTPSYGRETSPETVTLVPALQAPAGGTLRPLVGAFGSFGSDCGGDPATAGSACGQFNWPEVGIITLTPNVGDGDYLGAGGVSGTALGNVGRFYPASFGVAHSAADGCGSAFTYAGETGIKPGQPFVVSGTVSARNVAGEITTNYSGVFAKLTAAGITASTMQNGNPTDGVLSWGIDGLLFNSGSGSFVENDARYAFALEAAPQSIYLRIHVLDSDGVGGEENNPATAREYRVGRLRLINAFGAEVASINVPFLAEYFTAGGFYTRNSDDGCTMLTLASNLLLRNAATSAGVWLSGTSAMNIGSGVTTASPLQAPLVDGDAALWFTAPGIGNTGYVELRSQLGTSHPWLSYGWNCDAAAPRETCARVDFGRYQGSPRHIYLRERY